MQVTINGHASVLVASGNCRVLVDPLFDDVFASGTLCFRPARQLDERELTQGLDALVVTHAHLDHFHAPTLNRLNKQLPLFAPKHDMLLGELRKLGFENVIPLGPWQSFELEGLTMTATPSDFEWEEFGLVFQQDGASYWHMSDSIVAEEVGQRLRHDLGPIGLVACKYQPVRTLIGYQRGVSALMLDREELVNAFSAARAVQPAVLFPYAHGFAFTDEYAWANRHLGPYSAAEAAELLRHHLHCSPAPDEQQVVTVQPGDVFEIEARQVKHLPQTSPWVSVKSGPAVQHWEPIDPTTLHGVETADERVELRSQLRELMRFGVSPWMRAHLEKGTGVFDAYREMQVVWQGVVHAGDGERINYSIDFRKQPFVVHSDRVHPEANVFSHISGRCLSKVLRKEAGAEVFWMAGGYRQYEKILMLTPRGLIPPPVMGWELLDRLPDPITHYLRKVGPRLLVQPEPRKVQGDAATI